jgi:hypothetical protein
MEKINRCFLNYFFVFFLLSLLVACKQVIPLSQENFDKVQPGMSMKEVGAILGEPARSESINFGGLSGTSATWKNLNATANIIFINDKVQIKSFDKNEQKEKQIENGVEQKTTAPAPLEQPDQYDN